jgi:hypothetical protein
MFYSTTLHDPLSIVGIKRDKKTWVPSLKPKESATPPSGSLVEPGVPEDGYLSAFAKFFVPPATNCDVNRRLRTHPAEAPAWSTETIP